MNIQLIPSLLLEQIIDYLYGKTRYELHKFIADFSGLIYSNSYSLSLFITKCKQNMCNKGLIDFVTNFYVRDKFSILANVFKQVESDKCFIDNYINFITIIRTWLNNTVCGSKHFNISKIDNFVNTCIKYRNARFIRSKEKFSKIFDSYQDEYAIKYEKVIVYAISFGFLNINIHTVWRSFKQNIEFYTPDNLFMFNTMVNDLEYISYNIFDSGIVDDIKLFIEYVFLIVKVTITAATNNYHLYLNCSMYPDYDLVHSILNILQSMSQDMIQETNDLILTQCRILIADGLEYFDGSIIYGIVEYFLGDIDLDI